jgi:hypothetical protein
VLLLKTFLGPLQTRNNFDALTSTAFREHKKMGKRKAKKKSNSVAKTVSYFKRFQVKFARRRAGTQRVL